MKGAIEELDPPEPVPEADGAPVPAGELVVEAGVAVALVVATTEVATADDAEASVVLAAVDAGAA